MFENCAKLSRIAVKLTKIFFIITVAFNFANANNNQKFITVTLDGVITMQDDTGNTIWGVNTGSVFSSSISSLEVDDNGKMVNLIPSLTGRLYKHDGESLRLTPLNSAFLLKTPLKISENVVVAGGNENEVLKIDIDSGEIVCKAGITSGCSEPHLPKSSMLVLQKQVHTVRAIDMLSSNERWNFSVGTYELVLEGFEKKCHNNQESTTGNKNVQIRMHDTSIAKLNREKEVIWKKYFGSPISHVWVLENDQLTFYDPVTNSGILGDKFPSLYLGSYNGQLYIQESRETAENIDKQTEGRGFVKMLKLSRIFLPTANKISDQTVLSLDASEESSNRDLATTLILTYPIFFKAEEGWHDEDLVQNEVCGEDRDTFYNNNFEEDLKLK